MNVTLSIAPAGVAPALTFTIFVTVLAISGLMAGTAISPDGGRTRRSVVVLVCLALALLPGGTMLAPYFVRFTIDAQSLKIRGDLWGRTIPLAQLRIREARALDWSRDSAFRPVRRSGGSSLPGYMGGWWNLANGSRALLFVTDRSRVVMIPAADGYLVLLTPDDPGRFLTVLAQAVTSGR